jgi:HJR/Mrr/RecB family endonuclease
MEKFQEGIYEADFFLMVISENSVRSRWATQEFFLAYNSQLRDQERKILPVRIDNVTVPSQVLDLDVLDLFQDYEKGLQTLLQTILQTTDESLAQFPIDQTYDRTTIITVSDLIGGRLVEYFARHPQEMKSMDRRKFEELIAEIFDGFGYEVELTQQTRDGGRDIIAVRRREVHTRYLIECKRPDPGTPVGIRPVRELFGVKTDERATKAILATTAYFSRDALLFFDRNRWEMEPRDYDGIVEWLKMYHQSIQK